MLCTSDAEQLPKADPLPVYSEESILLRYGIHGDLLSKCMVSAGHSADGSAAACAGGV